ncbi:MAG: transporter, partial [Candidatus Aminicenantes bacterium]|nr:transporter [Candidatus Aminicenantes bacterium]
IYGFLHWQFSEVAFLNRMAITFCLIILIMALITLYRPLKKPIEMPVRESFDMKPSKVVKWLGLAVIVVTVILYIIFW